MSQSDTIDTTDAPELDATITSDRLREVIGSISHLVDEARFHFDPDALRVRFTDPANVGMVHLELSVEAFESYESSGGAIGINIKRIEDFFECVGESADIQIETVRGEKKYRLTSGPFSLEEEYITPGTVRKDPDEPDLDLLAEFEISTSEFSQMVECHQTTGRNVGIRLRYHPDKGLVTTSEGDTSTAEYTIPNGILSRIQERGEAESLFSKDYLNDLVEALPEGQSMKMGLGDEHPMKMKYTISEGKGTVLYFQAPRITS